jgi:hypothetical protein
MISKLMTNLYKQAKVEIKNNAVGPNSRFAKKNKVINLDYADNLCHKLFSFRQDEKLESRIRFRIQDVIDNYNKDWRHIVSEVKSRVQDSEGFKKIYVPKDQIFTEEQVYGAKNKSHFANDKKKGDGPSGYFYRQKSPKGEKEKEDGDKEDGNKKPSANKMANLLSCLQGNEQNKFIGHDPEAEEDSDANDVVERRQSLNRFNELGMNLQKYQDIKPSQGVRREILNMFNEYKELEDKKHAMDEFNTICNQYDLEKF